LPYFATINNFVSNVASEKGKVKLSITCQEGTEKRQTYSSTHSPHAGATKGWLVKATPWPLYLREGKAVRTVQENKGASGPVWASPENLTQPGFESRILQPLASLYTNYANPAPIITNSRFLVLFHRAVESVKKSSDSFIKAQYLLTL
jgi:hypothetical protein